MEDLAEDAIELEGSGRMGDRKSPNTIIIDDCGYHDSTMALTGGPDDSYKDILTTETDSCILGSERTRGSNNNNSNSNNNLNTSFESIDSYLYDSDRTYSAHTWLTGSDKAESEHTARTLVASNGGCSPLRSSSCDATAGGGGGGGGCDGCFWTPDTSEEFISSPDGVDPSPTTVTKFPLAVLPPKRSGPRRGKRWPVRSDAAHPNPPFLVFLEDGWRGILATSHGRSDSDSGNRGVGPSTKSSTHEEDEDEYEDGTHEENEEQKPGTPERSLGTGMRTFSSEAARISASSDEGEDQDVVLERRHPPSSIYDPPLDTDSDAGSNDAKDGLGSATDEDRETQGATPGGGGNIPPSPPTREVIVPAPRSSSNIHAREDEWVSSDTSEPIRGVREGTRSSNRFRDEENVDTLLFPPDEEEENAIDHELSRDDGSLPNNNSNNNNRCLHSRSEIPYGDHGSHRRPSVASEDRTDASEKETPLAAIIHRVRIPRKCLALVVLTGFCLLLVFLPYYNRQRRGESGDDTSAKLRVFDVFEEAN